MMNFDWQIVLGVLVLGLMAIGILKQGRENPVGTGHILKQHGDLDHRLTFVEAQLKSVATKADIAEVKGEVKALERTVEGVAGHTESTDKAVVRIEALLNQVTISALTPPQRGRRQ